jgi:hypothetical protein
MTTKTKPAKIHSKIPSVPVPSTKVTKVPLDKIVNKFDVREKLDDDRILFFVDLYEAGAPVPPITVVRLEENEGYFAFVDGRHRAQALLLLDHKECDAIIQANRAPATLLAEALAANWGGSKPPTRQDITHTVTRMFEAGASRQEILALLHYLPGRSLQGHISSAISTITLRKKRKALDLISDGMSIAEAARAIDLSIDVIKDMLAGRKRRWGTGGSQDVSDFKRYLTRATRGVTGGIAQKIQNMIKQAEEGEIPAKTAEQCILAWESNARATLNRVKDWQQRFEAAVESNNGHLKIDDSGD